MSRLWQHKYNRGHIVKNVWNFWDSRKISERRLILINVANKSKEMPTKLITSFINNELIIHIGVGKNRIV